MSPFRISATLLITAALLRATDTRAAAQVLPTVPDLTYATVGTGELKLDLYLPSNAVAPYPCIVSIHGGGWSGGHRFPLNTTMARAVENGFAVASVSYRLTSQDGQYGDGVPVTFPAQIHDVKGAVRWLRANAETYALDPARFGSFGTSAGGHLSALLGTSGGFAPLEGTVGGNLTHSSRVQASADHFGPTNILEINLDVTDPPGSIIDHDAPSSPESRLVGWDEPGQGIGDIRANEANPQAPYPALVTRCRRVNPVSGVSVDDPPFYIAHGTADQSVPLAQSVRLSTALSAIDHDVHFRAVDGAGHGALGAPTSRETVAFFSRTLRAPGDIAEPYGRVDTGDLVALLAQWGACSDGCATLDACPADIAGAADGGTDCEVGTDDLIRLLANWG